MKVFIAGDIFAVPVCAKYFYHRLVREVRSFGFEQCTADGCVTRLVEDGAVSWLLLCR